MENNGIQGRTAIVTGGSRGIGAATAKMLAREGAAKLVLHYNSNRKGAEELAAECNALGAAVELIGADLGREEGIAGFVLQVKQKAPECQILINNAGHLVKRAKLAEFTSELWDEVMNLNAKSVYLISQAVAAGMAAAGGGCIINLSSIAARNGGGPGATVYAASKAAVACITKGMAKELAPKGIRVNAVSPGTVDNYFHEKYSTRQMLDSVVSQTPAGKLGTNEEIADCIQFLLSPGAAYILGQTIEINGGMYMV
ncbi:MAG: SDR family oxidoreductase [Acidobacteria bacterium]|nr:SDR family oxidoreductase [Acidobacteriota bacterium]